MPEFIRFDSSNLAPLVDLGLDADAVSKILLGESCDSFPSIPEATPDWARWFILREYQACEVTFRAIAKGGMEVPHPVTGEPTHCTRSFSRDLNSTYLPALFKAFGDRESGFCLVFGNVTSRVTHVVVPSHGCVVYDIDPVATGEIWEASMAFWSDPPPVTDFGSRIVIVDMVNNYAHQAMNHLSGIERLVGSGLLDQIDEVWLLGKEFFGLTEKVFPEISGKLHRKNHQEIISILDKHAYDAYKLGSTILPANLAMRIRQLSINEAQAPSNEQGKSPLIAFTIRSDGRRCLNLPEVVAEVVEKLSRSYPNLGVVLDGWVFPESSIQFCSNTITALLQPYKDRMLEEAELCSEVARRLRPGVIARNLIGTSILNSVRGLQDIDVYVAHVGTLQHKVGWFTSARGVVHGPTSQLDRLDTGAYSFEGGHPPVAIPDKHVRDVPVDSLRGKAFFDYEIVDTSAIVSEIIRILEGQPVKG